jgi:putative (di)nucleoside polyphosphate hydrolase
MTQSDHNISLLPYRLGVGMMILNKHNQVFVGKRVDAKVEAWQMPQGGIDIGETPSRAALREMEEEIGTKNGNIISETKNWYSYDLPKFLIPKLWNGQYKGQKQKWFLINFTGEDSEIEVETNHPEFEDWRWVDLLELTEIIIPFKRKLYEAVMCEFKPLLRI